MKQIVNKVYEPLFQHERRIRYAILMGGRGAGRSTVASQLANAKLIAPEYFRCAIMRYVLGDIRNSIYREITDRAEENGVIDELGINDGTMTIEYGNNSINAVGFRKSSSDQKAKLKSLANYNCVIIEEADETPEADFMQLDDSLRTMKGDVLIILLLNPPPKTHWIIQRWFDLIDSEQAGFYIPKLKAGVDDVLFIHTDYRVNEVNIAPHSIQNYENYKLFKPDHYWNMIRGLVPEVVRGKIYKDWQIIDEIPFEAKLVRDWLDFGFTVDPTSYGRIYELNGGYILDEVVYQTDLKNYQIASIITAQKEQTLVIADSSEPKSIEEVKLGGVTLILPAEKGPDSVRSGIDIVQSQKISITRRSVNTIKEYDNYAWYEDKDGTRLNEPKPGFDHSMDGIRYAITSLKKQTNKGPVVHYSQQRKPLRRIGG